jgi:hypothetical protein
MCKVQPEGFIFVDKSSAPFLMKISTVAIDKVDVQ